MLPVKEEEEKGCPGPTNSKPAQENDDDGTVTDPENQFTGGNEGGNPGSMSPPIETSKLINFENNTQEQPTFVSNKQRKN